MAAGLSPSLDERRFGEFLYTAGQPDPDLLIRTSGEMRVSNFSSGRSPTLKSATETLWPDFRRRDLRSRCSPTRSAIDATAASPSVALGAK